MKNVIYIKKINCIGGTETFIYYLIRKYSDYDIVVYYQTGDYEQVQRLKKYARIKKYHGEKIVCEKAIFNYNTDIIDKVDAKEYIQGIHTDFKEQQLCFTPHPKIDRYIGVTQIACDSFKEYTGLDCELCYNPLFIEKPKKLLKLVSATRLTKEKGASRMQELAQALDREGIPFIWLVFTDDVSKVKHPNVICLPQRLDIMQYIAGADYLVQLSNKR